MKKPTCAFLYGRATPTIDVHVVFFSFIPQGNEKNQQSILKYLKISKNLSPKLRP